MKKTVRLPLLFCLLFSSSFHFSQAANDLAALLPRGSNDGVLGTWCDRSGPMAGTSPLRITDFCDLSIVSSYELEDPSLVFGEIVFAYHPMEVVHPINCGSNAQGGQLNPNPQGGVAPYSFLWSTGETTASISDLADGSYTVTVSDFGGDQQAEKTYYVGMTAGPDLVIDCFPDYPQIGLDHSLAGIEIIRYTCQSDSILYPAGACRTGDFIGRSAHWKSFDLANDYGVNTEVTIAGVEVFLQSIPNTTVASSIPIKASLYIASTPNLDDSGLQLIALDSIETTVPSIPQLSPYYLPLSASSLSPNDILAVKIETLTDASAGHIFGLGASSIPAPRPTYYTSLDCGVISPIAMPDAGFNDYVAMTILGNNNPPSGLFYQWDGPVSDPFSPTPLALGAGVTVYTVTITDAACGITVVDEVSVTCETESTRNQESLSFDLFPNPNEGIFQIRNKGENRKVDLLVFDLRGHLLRQEQRRMGNGDRAEMDFLNLPKGLYFIHLKTGGSTELLRLVIH